MLPFAQRLASHSRLSPEEQAAILDLRFQPMHVNANQDFVQQDETVTNSCFVLAGLVGTFGQNRRGERQITSVFLSGDMIDLYTVVVPQAPASIQALTPTTILKVPHSELRNLAARHPGIAEAFWRECVIGATIISEWVTNVGRRDARSRLAHVFCEIACRSGWQPVDNEYVFDFPITQNHLADMLGLTPVHVNRTLKGLREDRLLELQHRTVKILNWERLSQIGDFDPAYLRLSPTCDTTIEPIRIVSPPIQN